MPLFSEDSTRGARIQVLSKPKSFFKCSCGTDRFDLDEVSITTESGTDAFSQSMSSALLPLINEGAIFHVNLSFRVHGEHMGNIWLIVVEKKSLLPDAIAELRDRGERPMDAPYFAVRLGEFQAGPQPRSAYFRGVCGRVHRSVQTGPTRLQSLASTNSHGAGSFQSAGRNAQTSSSPPSMRAHFSENSNNISSISSSPRRLSIVSGSDGLDAIELEANDRGELEEVHTLGQHVGLSSRSFRDFERTNLLRIIYTFYVVADGVEGGVGGGHADITSAGAGVRLSVAGGVHHSQHVNEKEARKRMILCKFKLGLGVVRDGTDPMELIPASIMRDRRWNPPTLSTARSCRENVRRTVVCAHAAAMDCSAMPAWKRAMYKQLVARNRTQRDPFEVLVEAQQRLLQRTATPLRGESQIDYAPRTAEFGDNLIRTDDLIRLMQLVVTGQAIHYIVGQDGSELAYRMAVPTPAAAAGVKPVANVILVPGLFVNSLHRHFILEALVRILPVNGFTVDMRGHGMSSGKRGDTPNSKCLLKDLRSMVKHVRLNFPGLPLVITTHGIGASIVLKYAKWKRHESPDAYFIMAPFLHLLIRRELHEWFGANLGRKYVPVAAAVGDFFNAISRGALYRQKAVDCQAIHDKVLGKTEAINMRVRLDMKYVQGNDEREEQSFPKYVTGNTIRGNIVLNPKKAVAKIDRPFGVAVGELDELFDARDVLALFEPSVVSNKHLEIVPGVGHIGLMEVGHELLANFIKTVFAAVARASSTADANRPSTQPQVRSSAVSGAATHETHSTQRTTAGVTTVGTVQGGDEAR